MQMHLTGAFKLLNQFNSTQFKTHNQQQNLVAFAMKV